MTTAIRTRACPVGIFGIAKIGTSHLGRIVLRFSHEALTPLRSAYLLDARVLPARKMTLIMTRLVRGGSCQKEDQP